MKNGFVMLLSCNQCCLFLSVFYACSLQRFYRQACLSPPELGPLRLVGTPHLSLSSLIPELGEG